MEKLKNLKNSLLKTCEFDTAKTLELATFWYFSLPVWIYLVGSSKAWVTLVFSIFYFLTAYKLHRLPKASFGDGKINLSLFSIIGVIALIFLWGHICGQGSLGKQTADWYKHNAMFNSLIKYEWPIFHPIEKGANKGFYVVYYFGYYIYSALFGKLFGYLPGLRSQVITANLGLFIAVMWAFRGLGALKIRYMLFLILFSGLDLFGNMYVHGKPFMFGQHLEFWIRPWQFSGSQSQFAWVPQHMITSWAFAGIIYNQIVKKHSSKHSLLWFSLTAFWSPFATIGLFCFYAYHMAADFLRNKKLKDTFSFENLFGIGLLLLMMIYLSSGVMNHPSGRVDPVWPRFFRSVFLFASFEFLPLFLYLFLPFFKEYKTDKRFIFIIMSLTMFGLLYYKFGTFNDLCMRGVMPSLFIFMILLLDFLRKSKTMLPKWALIPFFLYYGAGAFNAISEMKYVYHPVAPRFHMIWESPNLSPFGTQYYALPESPFFKYLTVGKGEGIPVSSKDIDHMKASGKEAVKTYLLKK